MGPLDPRSEPPALTKEMAGLAAMFLTSGVVHLLRPGVMVAMVPRSLPGPRQLIYVSGIAELLCAGGLLHPRTRRIAGWGSAAVLLAVLPANVQMAATARKRARRDTADTAKQAMWAATIARLPLQVPLIRTALKAAGRLR